MRHRHHLGFRPSRHRGQNFLSDRSILRRIADAAEVKTGTSIVEIGAGTGNLTEELLRRGLRVIAIEVESELVLRLQRRLEKAPNLTIVNADARKVCWGTLSADPYHVVANLPYSVGTRIVIDLLTLEKPPLSITVLLQREVAKRIVAPQNHMALLSVIVQSRAKVKTLFDVPRTAFRPRPKVESSLVRLCPLRLDQPKSSQVERRIWIARLAFAQPRKQLRNSLAAGLHIDQATAASILTSSGIDPSRRPGTLTLGEWDAIGEGIELARDAVASISLV